MYCTSECNLLLIKLVEKTECKTRHFNREQSTVLWLQKNC